MDFLDLGVGNNYNESINKLKGRVRMEKEEKEVVKETKKGKGKTITIIILILLVLGMGGYIAYDKYFSKELNHDKEIKGEKEEEKNQLENLDISSNQVKTAMDSFNKIFITESELYDNNGYSIDSITNNDLVGSAIKLVDDKYFVSACEYDKEREAITMDYLNERLSNYFINKTIDMNNIKRIDNEVSYSIAQYEIPNLKYGSGVGIIIEGDSIKLVSTCGNIFSANPYIERKIVKAEEDNEYLYVYEKQAFAKYNGKEDSDNGYLVDYYKDYQKKEKVESDIESAESSEVKPNFDLYNTYKYTFKKQDNKYFFIRFELDK